MDRVDDSSLQLPQSRESYDVDSENVSSSGGFKGTEVDGYGMVEGSEGKFTEVGNATKSCAFLFLIGRGVDLT